MSLKFIQRIETQCAANPSAIALSTPEQQVDYQQLWNQVGQLREQLRATGAHRIAVALANCPAWVALDLAAILEGVVTVAVPHFFSSEQLQHLISDAGIELLISDANSASSLPGQPTYHCLESTLCLQKTGLTATTKNDIPESVFKISYTSGTTGDPKGVLISEQLVSRSVDSILQSINAGANYRHLSVLPYSLLLENIVGIYTVLAAGGCCYVPDFKTLGLSGSSNVDWARFTAVINWCQPQSMITVPALLQGLLYCIDQHQLDVRSLEFIAVGGAPISTQLLELAAQTGLPVFQGYGMTECGSVVCLNTPEHNRIGSVGKALSHLNIEIGAQGEIVIHGFDFPGYANRPDSACRRTWHSGDLGYIDDDGYLFVTARKHSTYSTAFGRNVAPEWVESELESMPAIARASLFGEGRKQNVAVIVAAQTALPDSQIERAVEQANLRLPDYARVARWVRADQPFSPLNQQQSAAGTLCREQIYEQYQHRIEPLFNSLNP